MAESGYAGFDATFSLVLFAPKGTPRPVVEAMQAALGTALKQPDVVERLRQTDQVVIAETPDATAQRLAADSRKWGAVAKKIGLQLD